MRQQEPDDDRYRPPPRQPPPPRRPLLSRYGYDPPKPADPTFVRLCQDINLANDARAQVRSGEIAEHYLEQAEHLERESSRHLAAYLAAIIHAEAK
jgi:hypothetical protein